MYKVDNALPGDSVEKCIKVTYTSPTALNSTVSLFMATPIGSVGPYVDMTVDVGTQATSTFPDCTGFTSTAHPLHRDAGGLPDRPLRRDLRPDLQPQRGLAVDQQRLVVYRVKLTLQNTPRQPGEDFSGLHDYTWQATSV